MKSNYGRYRKLRWAAFTVIFVAVATQFGVGFLFPRAVLFAIVAVILLGMVALVLFYAANDCLTCPCCGQRVVKEIRKTWDKEDCDWRRKILRGEKITCCCCGAEIDTVD